MNKILEESLLYDFYGELLTGRQRELYENVRFGDLSLSEAAEEYGISRQGVHDMLKRVENALHAYEEKLGLVERFMKSRETAAEIRKLCQEIRDTGKTELIERIMTLTEEWEEQ